MRKRYQLLNVDVNNFQKFCEWKKRLVVETLLLKFISNLFTYVKGLEVRVSLHFAE